MSTFDLPYAAFSLSNQHQYIPQGPYTSTYPAGPTMHIFSSFPGQQQALTYGISDFPTFYSTAASTLNRAATLHQLHRSRSGQTQAAASAAVATHTRTKKKKQRALSTSFLFKYSVYPALKDSGSYAMREGIAALTASKLWYEMSPEEQAPYLAMYRRAKDLCDRGEYDGKAEAAQRAVENALRPGETGADRVPVDKVLAALRIVARCRVDEAFDPHMDIKTRPDRKKKNPRVPPPTPEECIAVRDRIYAKYRDWLPAEYVLPPVFEPDDALLTSVDITPYLTVSENPPARDDAAPLSQVRDELGPPGVLGSHEAPEPASTRMDIAFLLA